MKKLLLQINQCRACEKHLEPNPIIAASPHSRIVIIGQAPGRIVHQSGIPWNDKSGDTLRTWLGVDKPAFYDARTFALVPMGFCYPGKGRSGDLPPRHECAPLWHQAVLQSMKKVKLILLIGQYAQDYYLRENAKTTLTETVKNFNAYLPTYLPLPHPSPRNNIWRAKNKWFDQDVLPLLRTHVSNILSE